MCYEFPTELNELFTGAIAAAEHRSTSLTWWSMEIVTLIEAAALSFGLDPNFAIEYVNSSKCGSIPRSIFYSRVQEIKHAAILGKIKVLGNDKDKELNLDTMLLAEDVKRFLCGDVGKATVKDEKIEFNLVADQHLFDLWKDHGQPDIGGFITIIKGLKNHTNKSIIGECYGAGTKGEHQWTFELVINGDVKAIPYSTLGNKIREFKKRVKP